MVDKQTSMTNVGPTINQRSEGCGFEAY